MTDREILMAAYKLLEQEWRWDPRKRIMEIDENVMGGTSILILIFDENDKLVDRDHVWYSDE